MSQLQTIKNDITSHIARLAGANFARLSKDDLAKVLQQEIAENLLPLLGDMADAMLTTTKDTDERLEDLAGAVDGILDQDEDMLQPETTAKIIGVFQLGQAIAAELAGMLAKHPPDQITKRRLEQLLAAYALGVETVSDHVTAVTLVEENPDGADQDDDADDEDDGDEDDDQDDTTDQEKSQ